MLLDLNRIDPELKPILEIVPDRVITRANVAALKLESEQQTKPMSPEGLNETCVQVNSGQGVVDVYVFSRGAPAGAALLWMHGGGYLFGSGDDHVAKMIADKTGLTVYSVDYKLAPEYPFPTALEECECVLNWLMDDASNLEVDRTRVGIGGVSAGGGLTAGLALKNRDGSAHNLAFQLLLYPMLDNLHELPSAKFTNTPIWDRASSLNAWEMYLEGTPGEMASPYAAAIRAESLLGLPPTYICVGSEDLFRDECLAYANRLLADDVPTEYALFPGMYHGGDLFVPDAKVSKRLTEGYLRALVDALYVSR